MAQASTNETWKTGGLGYTSGWTNSNEGDVSYYLRAGMDYTDSQLALKANQVDLSAVITTKADKTYVDTKVALLADGSPKGPYATLTDLQTAFPTGTTGIYLVTADGKWYYWSGSAWTAGGTYQSVKVGDGTVTRTSLDDDLKTNVTEQWIGSPETLHAIVDKDGRAAFSLLEDGTIAIFKLSVATPIEFTAQSIEQTALKGIDTVNAEISDIVWGVIDNERRMSDLIIGQDGKVPDRVIADWRERMNVNQAPPVVFTCIGDSLTAGTGGGGTTYGSVLEGLSGITHYNRGVGGETSATITARLGGSAMIIESLVIPATTTAVQIFATPGTAFKNNEGKDCQPLRQGTGTSSGINPCYIGGVKGSLSITQTNSTSTDFVYYFTRETAGSAVTINRPTPLITDNMINRNADIMVIFMGQNGGWNDNADLIRQINSIVDYNKSAKAQYVVLGLHTNTAAARASLEADMLAAFGRRYINLRDYMTRFGLADAGLTATTQDTTDMASGKTPTSLMTDGTHFTAAGYTIIGNLIYKRMKDLFII